MVEGDSVNDWAKIYGPTTSAVMKLILDAKEQSETSMPKATGA